MTQYYYIWVMLASVAFPLAWSFEPQMYFFRKWGLVWKATLPVPLIFILWDIIYTKWEVWGFNATYHFPLKFLGLPIEEYSFFFIVPFCCLFIYESIRFSFYQDYNKKVPDWILWSMAALGFTLLLLFYDRLYTVAVSAGVLLIVLVVIVFDLKPLRSVLFFVSYLVVCIPFLIVNGVLTGAITSEPIVWYNVQHIIGIRCVTIPIEDFFYNYMIFSVIVFLYERKR